MKKEAKEVLERYFACPECGSNNIGIYAGRSLKRASNGYWCRCSACETEGPYGKTALHALLGWWEGRSE